MARSMTEESWNYQIWRKNRKDTAGCPACKVARAGIARAGSNRAPGCRNRIAIAVGLDPNKNGHYLGDKERKATVLVFVTMDCDGRRTM